MDYHVASNGEKGRRRGVCNTKSPTSFLYGHLSFVGKLRAMELASGILKFVQDRTADMVNPREIIADKGFCDAAQFRACFVRGNGRDEREAADLECFSERLNSLSRALGQWAPFGGRI